MVVGMIGLACDADAIDLHGKVSSQSGKAIGNAIVTLSPLGLADTTGADGVYSFSTGTSIAPRSVLAGKGIAFRDGVLEIPLMEPSSLKLEVVDTRGVRIQSEIVDNAPAGLHRWHLASGSARGNGLLLVKLTVGGQVTSFPYARLQGGRTAILGAGTSDAVLARSAAAADSLVVSAQGYLTKKVAVPSLNGTLDVTLDSNTSSKNPPGGSVGCGKSPSIASGSRTIQAAGENRSYMLRIPSGYDNQHPYPLVFAFHWNGGTMGDVDGGGTSGYTWSYYGMREKADQSKDNKMIFVTAQGIGNGWANTNGRDLALVDNMLALVKSELCVDTTRIFSMGFSYGGGMTNAIACARAKVFRAVAVYAGALLSGCEDGTKPIAYIGIHGLRDPTCGIAGGRSLRDRFVKNNGCPAQSVPEPAANSLKHVCTTYTGCKAGYPVRWCAFDGGGHTPAPLDGQTSDYGGGDKTWTKSEVWDFFTQF